MPYPLHVLCTRCRRTLTVWLPAKENPVPIRCPDPDCKEMNFVQLRPNEWRSEGEE
jgi:hypothetical protein